MLRVFLVVVYAGRLCGSILVKAINGNLPIPICGVTEAATATAA